MSTFLDHYPDCLGCPVSKWCGTAIASTKLCRSYKEKEKPSTTTIPSEKENIVDGSIISI